ncbi:hypothetical protein D9M70_300440 [compost metagenome]
MIASCTVLSPDHLKYAALGLDLFGWDALEGLILEAGTTLPTTLPQGYKPGSFAMDVEQAVREAPPPGNDGIDLPRLVWRFLLNGCPNEWLFAAVWRAVRSGRAIFKRKDGTLAGGSFVLAELDALTRHATGEHVGQ